MIRVLNEKSVNDGRDFCLLLLVILNQLDIVSETHFSYDTVSRELWLAILSSLLCALKRRGTFASESKVKLCIILY